MATSNQTATVRSAPNRTVKPRPAETRIPDTIESKNGLKALATAENMMKDGTPFVIRTSDGETHTVRIINVRRNNENEERGEVIVGYKQNGELKIDKMPVRRFAEGLNIGPEILPTLEREQAEEQQEKAAELEATLKAMELGQATLTGKVTTAFKGTRKAANKFFGDVNVFFGAEPAVDLIAESGFPMLGSSKAFKRMHDVARFIDQDTFELMMAKNVRVAFGIKEKLPEVAAEAEEIDLGLADLIDAKKIFTKSAAAAADELAAMVLGKKRVALAEVKNPDPTTVKEINGLQTGLSELAKVDADIKAKA